MLEDDDANNMDVLVVLVRRCLVGVGDAGVQHLAGVDGDLLVLGVGGKMGPTLARLARRAAEQKAAAMR